MCIKSENWKRMLLPIGFPNRSKNLWTPCILSDRATMEIGNAEGKLRNSLIVGGDQPLDCLPTVFNTSRQL